MKQSHKFKLSNLFNKNLLLFMGSGLIVSMAYMDPGNWGTNIAAGSTFNYALLWIVWLTSAIAMFFQYLSGKIGIAGYSLPELVKNKVKNKYLVLSYWIGAEIAILATDLAEFLGIVVALNILFGIPLLIGSVISIVEVLLFFFLTEKKFRNVEKAFIIFVSIISLSFVYEVFISKPNFNSILLHSVLPSVNAGSILLIVGIMGATIMPHALFVHSWLIKNKIKELKKTKSPFVKDKSKLLKYHLVDNIFSLVIAGMVNASMLIMAAAAFYNTGIIATLQQAYFTLIPLFGNFAAIVFGVALLISGIASSVTGALAGQSIMDGLTNFKLSLFVRRVITRFVNIIPFTIALLLGVEPLKVLVYSQVLLSLLIPLPLIPIILFTSKKKIMKTLVNKTHTTIIAWIFASVIIALNVYLIYITFTQ